MSFDASRFTFDPLEDFQGVVMQQGRPQMDSDWNEWGAEWGRRVQAGAFDILGPAVVPDATTPGGFAVAPVTDNQGNITDLSIGQGRMYVDGILTENHGLSPLTPKSVPSPDGAPDPAAPSNAVFDVRAGELVGGDLRYFAQPYLPNPAALPASRPFTAYLDVWQREITNLIQPGLVDPAVNVDTAGRIQTVWQVKAVAGDASCAEGLGGLLAAQGAFPSASRLTTDTVPVPSTDVCHVPPPGGFTGLENQLYRVEIHQGGSQNQASFKWSRVNATVATTVTAIDAQDLSLTVQSLGKDEVLGLSAGDWIEITDDFRELNGLPGDMARVTSTDPANFILQLAPFPGANPLGNYPTDSQGNTDPNRHTRVRRWDQSGKVLLGDGQTLYWDLDNPANADVPAGTIPLPPDAQTTLVLENGVTVAFSLDAGIAKGQFVSTDFWAFAARPFDRTVEKLAQAPPRGIHHHTTALTVVTDADCFLDLRLPWSPASTGCCRVNVAPENLQGGVTLQDIVDRFKNRGGTPTVVCLSTGNYLLDQPLRLTTEHRGLILEGCPGTVFSALPGSEGNFTDGMVVVTGFNQPQGRPPLDITLRGIGFSMPSTTFTPGQDANGNFEFAGLTVDQLPPELSVLAQPPSSNGTSVSIGLRVVNGTGLSIENCDFAPATAPNNTDTVRPADTAVVLAGNPVAVGFWAGIFATGPCDGIRVIGNQFHLRGQSSFMAGYLQVPSVAFNPPPPVTISAFGSNLGFVGSNNSFFGSNVASIASNLSFLGSTPAFMGSNAAILGSSFSCGGSNLSFVGSNLSFLGSNLVFLGSNLSFFSSFSSVASQPNFSLFGGDVLASTLDDSVFADNNFVNDDPSSTPPSAAVAVLVLGETGEVRMVGNEVAGTNAGFWVLSSLRALYLQYDFNILTAGLFAMGYPLPAGMTGTAIPAPQGPSRVFAGNAGTEEIQATSGFWFPDGGTATNIRVSGGHIVPPTPTSDTINGTNTTDALLYKSARVGNPGENITYTFTLPPSAVPFYQVGLKFAEVDPAVTHSSTAVTREFNILINGIQVMTDFNIAQQAGANETVVDLYFDNILPVNGTITVELQADTQHSAQFGPSISAVQIQPELLTLPTTFGGTQNFFLDLLGLSQQAFPGLSPAPSPMNLRVSKNNVSTQSLPALMVTGAAQEPQIQLLTVSSNQLVMAAEENLAAGVVENFNPNLLIAAFSLAGVAAVAVDGNQVLNNAFNADFALFLDFFDVLDPTTFAVAGNVFRGVATITVPNGIDWSQQNVFIPT